MLVDAPPFALVGSAPLLRFSRVAPVPLHLLHGGLEPQGSLAEPFVRALLEAREPEGTVLTAACPSFAAALAAHLAPRRRHLTAVLPTDTSLEHRALLRGWGARLVFTEVGAGRQGARRAALELATTTGATLFDPDALEPGPCALAAERLAETLAALEPAPGALLLPAFGVSAHDALRAALTKRFPAARVLTVLAAQEPAPDAVTHGASAAQGLLLEAELPLDANLERVVVRGDDAWEMARSIARREGVLLGPASAATLWAAAQCDASGPRVALGLDTGERYFSLRRFHHERGGAAS